jgi:hypothetical protein
MEAYPRLIPDRDIIRWLTNVATCNPGLSTGWLSALPEGEAPDQSGRSIVNIASRPMAATRRQVPGMSGSLSRHTVPPHRGDPTSTDFLVKYHLEGNW